MPTTFHTNWRAVQATATHLGIPPALVDVIVGTYQDSLHGRLRATPPHFPWTITSDDSVDLRPLHPEPDWMDQLMAPTHFDQVTDDHVATIAQEWLDGGQVEAVGPYVSMRLRELGYTPHPQPTVHVDHYQAVKGRVFQVACILQSEQEELTS